LTAAVDLRGRLALLLAVPDGREGTGKPVAPVAGPLARAWESAPVSG
jgi:hypothetical protein